MITTIASFIIFILYIVYILLKAKEIPISVSRTYYYLTWKPAFTLIIWLVGLLLLPEFMDAAKNATTQVIPFATIFGVFLVGASPQILEDKAEKQAHMIGAGLAGIFSQLWVMLYGNQLFLFDWILPGAILFWTLGKKRTNNLEEELDKFKFTFWVELICFINIYLSLLC